MAMVRLKNIHSLVSPTGTEVVLDDLGTLTPSTTAAAGTAADGHSDSASHYELIDSSSTSSPPVSNLYSFASGSSATATANGLIPDYAGNLNNNSQRGGSASSGTHALHVGGASSAGDVLKSFSSSANAIAWCNQGIKYQNSDRATGFCCDGTHAMNMGYGRYDDSSSNTSNLKCRKVSMVTAETAVAHGTIVNATANSHAAACNGTVGMLECGATNISNSSSVKYFPSRQVKSFASDEISIWGSSLANRGTPAASSNGVYAYFLGGGEPNGWGGSATVAKYGFSSKAEAFGIFVCLLNNQSWNTFNALACSDGENILYAQGYGSSSAAMLSTSSDSLTIPQRSVSGWITMSNYFGRLDPGSLCSGTP